MSASDIGYVRATFELFDHAVQRWKPGRDQVGVVSGPEEALGATEQAGAVIVPAHAFTGTKSVAHLRLVDPQARHDLECAGHERRAVLVGEHHRLFRTEI